jgi:hypothetical protein
MSGALDQPDHHRRRMARRRNPDATDRVLVRSDGELLGARRLVAAQEQFGEDRQLGAGMLREDPLRPAARSAHASAL